MKDYPFRWQRILVLLASLAVMVASFRHLTGSYCALEPGESSGSILSQRCFPAFLAAGAIDLSVLVLTRLALEAREHGGKIGVILASLALMTVLSVTGNVDTGLAATVARDSGGSGALWGLDDLRSLDWLSVARVVIFYGTLPVTVLLLTISGARAAAIAHGLKREPEPLPALPVDVMVREEPQRRLTRQPRPRFNPAVAARVSEVLTPEDGELLSTTGRMSREERMSIVRDGLERGLSIEQMAQISGAGVRTIFRDKRIIEAEGDLDGRML